MDPATGTAPLLGDFFRYADLLTDEEHEVVARVREFLRTEVAPVAVEHWTRAEFPHHLVPGFAALDIAALPYDDLDGPAARRLLIGFVALEIAHTDPSMNSFFGIHNGLAMGSIDLCGSAEQRARWLPAMARMERIGAFGLTEPDGGSDVARGLRTTARRVGSGPDAEWVLDGEKRWIGNGTFADLVVIWARDVADDSVKGFVVAQDNPGMTTSKIENKVALRTVQNADIVLQDCRVPESDRLQNAGSFADTNKVLRRTRGGVAWGSTGTMMAAYEVALAYAKEREQFGRPIAGFQLVQDLLVRMLGNITASFGMAVRLAQLQDAGEARDEHAALAKEFCTSRMRETVALAREVVGGNGVVLDYGVAKFFADAEALYSFEGTRQINTLVVGRAITGHSAFI
ncbi:acyl-CoA dehydrogenase family protein [Pseudonocardia xinjiangensis]|uniref:Acyl-CoA dehydrogenase n=1 Tax=Pseudonocardia xinjiangensis TaxID=75289 RepID=A0ABX1RC58_9PSEU|nr:acyl-CoA dehydrogenase family protein [Pseudonocardia xinjiangensis]NMH76700.1 acyl-CoA dehydrogenase [Pseudonocardia xinjiangensis]